MLRTDLDTLLSMGPSTAVRLSRRCVRLCFPGFLFVYCAGFGALQCSAQDLAEAARQERAQKESKQKKSKHVYTEQELKRAQILTPEDRAQVEAKKNQPAPPSAEKSTEAVDAQSLPGDAPLGDVARRFRKQKQSQKLQQSAEFHLPFADAPALASPKPPCARDAFASAGPATYSGNAFAAGRTHRSPRSGEIKCRDGEAGGLPLETRAAEPRQRSPLARPARR